MLLNALYLKSQGKLQNGPGYIRAGIEEGYELLPQVASRLETPPQGAAATPEDRAVRHERRIKEAETSEEEEAIRLVLESLTQGELDS